MPARDTDHFADYAAQCIAATLRVEVEPWDRGGRQGAHDLRYEHEGRSVAVEVKRVVDEDYRQMQGEIDKQVYQPHERLSRLWHVRLRDGAWIKALRRELPDILAFLDEIGWDRPHQAWQLRRTFPALADRLKALGVWTLYPTRPTEAHPPGYFLHHEGWSRWGEDDIDELVSFACAYLTGDRGEVVTLRRQLHGAQTDERHAFLFIGLEHTVGWLLTAAPIEGAELSLPTRPPTLPEPVDGLWLTGWSPVGRVIAWRPHVGWIEGSTVSTA